MKINFCCPSCKTPGARIEEIMVGVVQASDLIEVHECGDAEYGDMATDGGVVDRFQCIICGYSIKTMDDEMVTDLDGLYQWLDYNRMLDN